MTKNHSLKVNDAPSLALGAGTVRRWAGGSRHARAPLSLRLRHSLLLAGLMLAGNAAAAVFTWAPGGTGTINYGDGDWNMTDANWTTDGGATATTWENGSTSAVTFGGVSGSGPDLVTIDLQNDVELNSINMSASYWPAVLIRGGGTITFSGSDPVINNNNMYRAITIESVITGTRGFTKSNSGTLILKANNNYTANTNIRGNASANGGVLQVGDGGTSGTLGTGAVNMTRATGQVGASTLRFKRADAITVNNRINVMNETSGGIIEHSGNALLTLSGQQDLSGNGNYRIHNATGNGAVDAVISGRITGAGGLIKSGKGTLLLTATNNSYGGSTLVEDGTLLVANVNRMPGGPVQVAGGGAFGFGASAGGDFTNFEMDSLEVEAAAATADRASLLFTLGSAGNDKLSVGVLDFSGSGSINIVLIDATGGAEEMLLAEPYTLLSWAGGTGLTSLSQVSLDGSDSHLLGGKLILTEDSLLYMIPEPSTWALLGGGGALLLALFRRRRAVSRPSASLSCAALLAVSALLWQAQPALAQSFTDSFADSGQVALADRAAAPSLRWKATANLRLGSSGQQGIATTDEAQFMGAVTLRPDWKSVRITAKVMPQSALDKPNWIAVGLGDPSFSPVQFTWPQGVFLLVTSAGRYELVEHRAGSPLKVLRQGRVPGYWEDQWNEVTLDAQRDTHALSISINGQQVVSDLVLEDPAALKLLQAGFSGYSQVPGRPAVGQFALTAE